MDFGTSVMTINRRTASKLKLPLMQYTSCIKEFGGGLVGCIGKTEKLKLKIDEIEMHIPFLMVADRFQNIPLIIGQPFKELKEVLVIKNSETLRFLKNTALNKKIPVRVVGDVLVPPGYTGFAKCTANTSGDVYIEGSVRLKEGQGSVI